MTVGTYMSKKVISINEEETIEKALDIFKKNNFNYIPVVDDMNRFLGVVSEKDILGIENWKANVKSIISNDYIKVCMETPKTEMIKIFLENPKFSIIFVVNRKGILAGVVTRNDILKLLTSGDIPFNNNALFDENISNFFNNPYLKKLLNSLHEGVIVVDSNTKVIFANRAYSRILGVQPHKVLNRFLSEIEPEAKIIQVLKTGVPMFEQTINIKSLGTIIVANITPLKMDEKIIGAISTFSDITEIISITNQLEKTTFLNDFLAKELKEDTPLPESFKVIIGSSKKLKKELAIAARVAKTDSSVLILGESGTGKELVAKAIHDSSSRRDKPFVKINCAAVPDNLIESELFGYEDGAFTGAKKGGKIGKIEQADGGTLFLDEIGDMPLFMQPKLLRFLQEKEFEKVGGIKTQRVDVRIIAATNRDLEEMVKNKQFREDLFYRVNVFTINLPPLRERRIDIVSLIKHYTKVYNDKYEKNTDFSKECLEVFLKYEWPGNIRELKNVIEHAIVMSDDSIITLDKLPRYFKNLSDKPDEKLPVPPTKIKKLNDIIRDVEKQAIIKALDIAGQNKSRAIELLGISRRTFYKKMKEYNIQ
ncbi:MAG: sigma 54-interacting transcriptional regulator [Firmicutes bacterium]|nr:sigma 54-interacting transcriptional regulator [Bacillota bacterium]